jgi:hypothetical protein
VNQLSEVVDDPLVSVGSGASSSSENLRAPNVGGARGDTGGAAADATGVATEIGGFGMMRGRTESVHDRPLKYRDRRGLRGSGHQPATVGGVWADVRACTRSVQDEPEKYLSTWLWVGSGYQPPESVNGFLSCTVPPEV